MTIDASLRRICNQGFFERVHVYAIETVDPVEAEAGEPFDTLLDLAVHAAALAREGQRARGGGCQPADVACLSIDAWWGVRGSNPRPRDYESPALTG